MKKFNFNLEATIRHIILGKLLPLEMACLHLRYYILRKNKEPVNSLTFKPLPQILENVVVKDKEIINKLECKKSIKSKK